jgi:hypothetical protein
MRILDLGLLAVHWGVPIAGAALAWRSAQRRKIVAAIAGGISLIAAVMLIEHHHVAACVLADWSEEHPMARIGWPFAGSIASFAIAAATRRNVAAWFLAGALFPIPSTVAALALRVR